MSKRRIKLEWVESLYLGARCLVCVFNPFIEARVEWQHSGTWRCRIIFGFPDGFLSKTHDVAHFTEGTALFGNKAGFKTNTEAQDWCLKTIRQIVTQSQKP